MEDVVIAGGSGFVGRYLVRACGAAGYRVRVLSRSARPVPGAEVVGWDGRNPGDWVAALEGAAGVIGLAGRNVNCRYTRRNLREIDRSRIDSVDAIGRAIAACRAPPAVWIQAATTAIHGDAGERWCDERSPPGDGVPVATASKWEVAWHAHADVPCRRVLLRMSFVLGMDGGPLPVLVALARRGLGGRAGSGRQYVSWIHHRDLERVVLDALRDPAMSGCYAVAAPRPVTNEDFMRALRRVLGRGWAPPTPAWAVRVGALLMRTEPVLVLTGRRVRPARLLERGFRFEQPDLPEALADVLG